MVKTELDQLAGVDGPAELVAVTATRIVEPTSAWTTP